MNALLYFLYDLYFVPVIFTAHDVIQQLTWTHIPICLDAPCRHWMQRCIAITVVSLCYSKSAVVYLVYQHNTYWLLYM